MLKKIRLDELRAELASVEWLIAQAHAEQDELGEMQFGSKRDSLQQELERLGNVAETSASVGLYFSGEPVFGSVGVDASFASGAIEAFQDLVTKQFAVAETGQLGRRGPVRLRGEAGLMISDVARGSFGFVLKESVAGEQIVESALASVVDDAAQLVANLASPDARQFEEAIAELEPRVLVAARKFFKTLDDAGATIRIVEGQRDDQLARADVQRGRTRTEQIQITEQQSVVLTGTLLGLLPIHRRFEFRLVDTGDVISGSVARDAVRGFEDQAQQDLDSPVHKVWSAEFDIREVTERNAQPRKYYTLVSLRDRVQNAQ